MTHSLKRTVGRNDAFEKRTKDKVRLLKPFMMRLTQDEERATYKVSHADLRQIMFGKDGPFTLKFL